MARTDIHATSCSPGTTQKADPVRATHKPAYRNELGKLSELNEGGPI